MINVNGLELDWHAGMTVAEAMERAGESAGPMHLVIVNSEVIPHQQLNTWVVADGAMIKLLTLISGG